MFLVVTIPAGDLLEKAFRGPRFPHKYISRKWDGKQWVYKYREIKAPRHGHEHADESLHSVDLPEEARHFDYPPEQGYTISQWRHQAEQLIATRKPQEFRDPKGNLRFVVKYKDPTEKRPGPRGIPSKFYVYRADGKLVSSGDDAYIRRWASRNALEPVEVHGVGGIHHTLHPSVATTKESSRPGWAVAKFNKEHKFDPYRGHAQDKRHFRTKEEYDQWWHAQLEWMLGHRLSPEVDIDEKTLRHRPMTAILEAGMIPWKVEEEKVAYRTGNRKFRRPVWKLDFSKVDFDKKEFMEGLLREHYGLVVNGVNRAIVKVFGTKINKPRRDRLFAEIQEEAIRSMHQAIDRYNPSRINPKTGRGYRFSTYVGTRMALDALKAAYKEKHAEAVAATTPEIAAGEDEGVVEEQKHEWSLDPEQRIDVHRVWMRAQKQAMKDKIAKTKDEGSKRFFAHKYEELLGIKDYGQAQRWADENDFLDAVIPIDNYESYIDEDVGKEIFGSAYRSEKKVNVQRKKWRKTVDAYFSAERVQASSKHMQNRLALVQKLVTDWAPDGDLQDPLPLSDLAAKHRKEIVKIFGEQAKSPEDQVAIVHKMLLREGQGFFASPGISQFLGKSIILDMLNLLLKKALIAVAVEETKKVVLAA